MDGHFLAASSPGLSSVSVCRDRQRSLVALFIRTAIPLDEGHGLFVLVRKLSLDAVSGLSCP